MGNISSITVIDGWRDASHVGPGTYETYLITCAGGSATTDYATGGQPFSLPSDCAGAQFVSLEVISRTPLTRQWSWNGSQSAPKLMAEDAFATQEGNGTTVNSDTLTCLLRVKR